MDPLNWLIPIFYLIFFVMSSSSVLMNTISPNNSLNDGTLLLSEKQVFALGFFSPGNSKNRYVGIWYNQIPEQTIVWVANRDNPINDTSGLLSINGQGNLVVHKRNQTLPVWSTDVSDQRGTKVSNFSSVFAQVLDSGNLVLIRSVTREVLWQSFDHPTHCMIPGMKLGINRKTGRNRFLTSWKSSVDPGTGNATYRMDTTGFPQLVLYKGSNQLWRTGSWTGRRWIGVPEMTHIMYIFNVTFVNNQDEVYVEDELLDHSIISTMSVDESGLLERFTWNPRDRRWVKYLSAPKEECDHYMHCGPNGNCDPYQTETFECTCLPGFEPKLAREWLLMDGSLGCVRKRGVSTCKNGEGFVKLARVKIPDTSRARVDMGLGLMGCEKKCLSDCSCTAYSSAYYERNNGTGCLTWHGDLMDTRTYSDAGQDLYIRVDAAELAHWKKTGSHGKKATIVITVAVIVAISLVTCFACCLTLRRKRERRRLKKLEFSLTPNQPSLEDNLNEKEINESIGNKDLPFLDLSVVVAATNNFSPNSKLGQGGFGAVYKGVIDNGNEIAVKRLSKCSRQGIEEFKNEITLIAKLQHVNLVRILGCCITQDEKMLIYEYLPNNSLDSFIFDEVKRSLLDWTKRFDIISGIARGVLYLHQDSRLRIIHRDLKASNVLLDATMEPKISDFGMAKIFGKNQVEANTNRVVGTYGYMSPEYAMEGLFSVKSDVYSFGVILLEIVTGKRNNGHYIEMGSLNLVGHIWDLWKVDKAMEIVDESLRDTYIVSQVLRCIHIGFLCVQELPNDRPTMSAVHFMLGNDSILPSPKEPAFILRRNNNNDDDTSSRERYGSSLNHVTITTLEAR